jgi:hypothetical protein
VLVACNSQPPCSNCVAAEGTYALTFDNAIARNGDCSSTTGLTEGTLLISRTGSALTGDFFATPLTGTLYENLNLTLSGTRSQNLASADGGVGNSDTLVFQLKYEAPSGSPPGPTHLVGSLTETSTRPNTSGTAASCIQTGAVTATRP